MSTTSEIANLEKDSQSIGFFEFCRKLLAKLLYVSIIVVILSVIVIAVVKSQDFRWRSLIEDPRYYLSAIVVILLFSSIETAREFSEMAIQKARQWKLQCDVEVSLKEQARKDELLWKRLLLERTSGFPSLAKSIEDYEKLRDDFSANYLTRKSHPALKAAEVVREQTLRRRIAETNLRRASAIVEYYELIAPFLIEVRDDAAIDDSEVAFQEYSEDEAADPATNYLSKEEFRSLSSVDRNQMALDRFWSRPKSNRLIGRTYERYVGYCLEKAGYNVEYHGIFKGYEDLGRDLIATKGHEVVVVQCKHWSKFRTIYENHIFQFFGTVFQYRDSNPGKSVRGLFQTTTQLSDVARRFAKELGIELIENSKFDQSYPCIKCNVSKRDKSRIYHLPFDQQYDNVKVEPHLGEFYCKTVAEAESKGFRRAFRYKGLIDNKG